MSKTVGVGKLDRAAIQALVIEALGRVLGDMDPHGVGPRTRLRDDLGLDSLFGAELAHQILSRLPVGLTLDGQSVEELLGGDLTVKGLTDFLIARLHAADLTGGSDADPGAAPLPWGEEPLVDGALMVEALVRQAGRWPARPAFTVHGQRGARPLSYGELLERALAMAALLTERGMKRGDRVLLCLPTSVDLLTAIYGVLCAGGVCVPVYPPAGKVGLEAWKEQAAVITRLSQPCGAVTTQALRLHISAVLERGGRELFTLCPPRRPGRGDQAPVKAEPGDLAFIQFTSGTTRQPRGAAISHGALAANVGALRHCMGFSPEDISVSWLPLYHDMGLVGHVFTPVASGTHQHLLPPAQFLFRPARWLELISELGATQTTAPNFAFSLCARRVTPGQLSRLDLGALRVCLNGAEPVLPETVKTFQAAFGPRGFRPEAMRPVYGLAEATLAVTLSGPGPVRVDRVDRERLAAAGRAEPCQGAARGLEISSVGAPIPGHQLAVVHPDGGPCQEREVGEVRVRGPSLMQGYFNDPVATASTLREGWLYTGDLGYLAGGRLHITGRRKEVVIKAGRNYAPQDFEAACMEVVGLRQGRAVALGLSNPGAGTEDLVLVAEVRDPRAVTDPGLRGRVAAAVSERTGLRPDRVLLVRAGTLPRTTSGKLQRAALASALERGEPLTPAGFRLLRGPRALARSLTEKVSARVERILGWR